MAKNSGLPDNWLEFFPALKTAGSAALIALNNAARLATVPAGQTLFQPGDQCDNFLLVVEGSIRVRKFAANGREIVLYRVTGGQSCVLTTSCLIDHQTYSAEGVSETAVTAAAIPRGAFNELLESCPVFSRFVLSVYSARIADLMLLVEEVAFRRMDARLAEYLVRHSCDQPVVKATHSQIAAELGTVREVISRQLKEFEHRGCCTLGRGEIKITGRKRLADLSRTL